jgi:hypothetical protein
MTRLHRPIPYTDYAGPVLAAMALIALQIWAWWV